jgi:hypothetical protein
VGAGKVREGIDETKWTESLADVYRASSAFTRAFERNISVQQAQGRVSKTLEQDAHDKMLDLLAAAWAFGSTHVPDMIEEVNERARERLR